MTSSVPHWRRSISVTPEQAWAAVLAGKTVRCVVGKFSEDPVCLHYLDQCHDDYETLMIYTEAIGGWSEGIKEAVCEPESAFYVEFVSDPPPHALTITDEEPPQREVQRRLAVTGRQPLEGKQ